MVSRWLTTSWWRASCGRCLVTTEWPAGSKADGPGEGGQVWRLRPSRVDSEMSRSTATGCHVAPVATPVGDGVEVHHQHLVMGECKRKLESQSYLCQGRVETGALAVELFGQLLGNGASAGAGE